MDEREKGVWRFKHHVVIVQLDTHATPIASELRTGVKFHLVTPPPKITFCFLSPFSKSSPLPFPISPRPPPSRPFVMSSDLALHRRAFNRPEKVWSERINAAAGTDVTLVLDINSLLIDPPDSKIRCKGINALLVGAKDIVGRGMALTSFVTTFDPGLEILTKAIEACCEDSGVRADFAQKVR